MHVDTIFSRKRIDLISDRSILDAFDGDYLNIRTEELNLYAGENIGSKNGGTINYFDINLYPGGILNAHAGGDIYLSETDGDMEIGTIVSTGGDVTSRAMASLLDAENDLQADVAGNNINLEARYGAIGISGNDLDIDSAFSGTGSLISNSALNGYITETDGDLGSIRCQQGWITRPL
jgi:hypothetical protein